MHDKMNFLLTILSIPTIIGGITTFSKDGKEVDPEEVAKGLCLMLLADHEGKLKDVTGEEL